MCLAFVALILIFTKAACDNVAYAGWGLNRQPLDGGPRTPLAVPLTSWTHVSNADSEWFIRFITVFPPQWGRCGESEARTERTHEQKQRYTERKLFSSGNPAKKYKCKDHFATSLNQHHENKWPVTFSAKQQPKKNQVIMGLTLTFLQFWWGTVSH